MFSYVQGEKLLELNFLAQSFKRLERMTASHPIADIPAAKRAFRMR